MASRSSNRTAVPEAKGALDKFKYEVASELGVPLTDGYNGDLTSRQNGSVGGYMVKKMIEEQERRWQEANNYYLQSMEPSGKFPGGFSYMDLCLSRVKLLYTSRGSYVKTEYMENDNLLLTFKL